MALTLIVGDAQQALEAHPTEIARRALMAASQAEIGEFSDQLAEFASTFPPRGGAVAAWQAVAPSDRAAKTRDAAALLSELESLLSADDPLKQAIGQLSLALKRRERRGE